MLQQGLSVSLLSQNTLPYAPRGLWTLRDEHSGFDRYMVISFNNATIVLAVGETVEQVANTGFKADDATLFALAAAVYVPVALLAALLMLLALLGVGVWSALSLLA